MYFTNIPLLSFLVFIIVAIGLTSPHVASSFSNGQPASYVIGQRDFRSNSIFAGGLGTSSRTLIGPQPLATDRAGNLWAGDVIDSRVLQYQAPFDIKGKAADLVVGKPDFTTMTIGSSPGTPTTSNILWPMAITFDPAGNLWVADSMFNRVLRFSPPFKDGMTADLVLGQPDFSSYIAISPSKQSLNKPMGLAFDPAGNLWVADTLNNRILRFSPPYTNYMAADLVLGQADFVTATAMVKGDLEARMNEPKGLVFSDYDLWVSDSNNNRILKFSPTCSDGVSITPLFSICLKPGDFTNGQPADIVLGQPDFVTIKGLDPPSKESLNGPSDVAFDADGNLWVADTENNRVLRYSVSDGYDATIESCKSLISGYDQCIVYLNELANVYASLPSVFITGGQKPDLVLGKADFVTKHDPDINEKSLNGPTGLTLDSSGNIWVADSNTNRILGFLR